jgi:hypothetical protein
MAHGEDSSVPVRSSAPGRTSVRAVAKIPEPPAQRRGVAKVTTANGQRTGRIYWPVEPERRPVFVDDTGRRGRWLAWLSLLLAVLGLALVVALWVSQVASTGA